ncbi:MAG: ATP-binding protein, partial [Planctomycetota bacterium]
MKILALNLRAFGPFTDVLLDFSGGAEGVHLVYGPNEAGKSSALRALEQFFFGIPRISSDDFIHRYEKLRIGARLRGPDGGQTEFFRRKGTKSTLLAADGQSPLDEPALRSFLGGVDRGAFTTMFGIDHERLQQGGLDIARGGGDVGQSLFAAGAGIWSLRTVRESLRSEEEELFKRHGSRPVINRALAEWKEARRAIRDAQLPSSKWLEHEEKLREADERLEEVEARLATLLQEKHRGERICEALPLVARRQPILDQQAGLGAVPMLPSDFAEKRREADASLRAARDKEKTAREEIERIDHQIGKLDVPEALLAQSERIERINQTLGSHRKAQSDLPRLKAERDQARKDAQRILREVAPDLSLDHADRLRLTSPQKAKIQNLGNRHEALASQLEQARQQIESSEAELAEIERALHELPSPRDPTALKDAVRRIRGEGDLEGHLAGARADLSRREEQASAELERLPHWCGPLEEMEKLAVPNGEGIDEFGDQLARSDRRLDQLLHELEDAEKRRLLCERETEQLRLEGEVPTEEELFEARRIRDLGWQLVLETWQQGQANAERLRQFLDRFEGAADLAAAYRQAVAAADQLA